MVQRDNRLDILRGIGLLCILFAHSQVSGLLFQLRNFDVPLMVLVAGAAFSLSKTSQQNYSTYLNVRFLRMVVPTWIFLTLFLTAWSFIAPFSHSEIICSYALLGDLEQCKSIDYVWVIRIFFTVSLTLPLLRYIALTKSRTTMLAFLGSAFVVSEVAMAYLPALSSPTLKLVQDLFYSFFPYALVAGLGFYLHHFSVRSRALMGAFFLSVFALCLVYFFLTTGSYVLTQAFKYPPRLYYLSYALGVSFLLSAAIEGLKLTTTQPARLVAWLGQRTMWIYLWHIVFAHSLRVAHLELPFVLNFAILLGGGVFCVSVQDSIGKQIAPHLHNSMTRRTLKLVFTG